MPIPDFQTLMLPVLTALGDGQASTIQLIARAEDQFSLSEDERAALLPSGRQKVIANRVHWAIAYLNRAALIERVTRGTYRVLPRGRGILAQPPERISIAFLRQFAEFRTLRPNDTYADPGLNGGDPPTASAHAGTPEERIAEAVQLIRDDLRRELLQRIADAKPAFFEQVVVELLMAMGYGADDEAGRVLGRSGDGGLDGVIREDRLGLDLIYVQAKRNARDNVIGPDKVREFAGALDFAGARKGVFITASRFTPEAERYAAQLQAKRIVLVDGERLTTLMLQHGVGVRAKGTPIIVQEIDLNYFDADVAL